MEHFSRVTRSGSILQRIQAILTNIENPPVQQNGNMECIIECGRKKAMLLLPCQHQHTCRECWLIWKIESVKQIPNDIFDQSFDENVMKPKCPICRNHVDEEIMAFN